MEWSRRRLERRPSVKKWRRALCNARRRRQGDEPRDSPHAGRNKSPRPSASVPNARGFGPKADLTCNLHICIAHGGPQARTESWEGAGAQLRVELGRFPALVTLRLGRHSASEYGTS